MTAVGKVEKFRESSNCHNLRKEHGTHTGRLQPESAPITNC